MLLHIAQKENIFNESKHEYRIKNEDESYKNRINKK